MSLSEFGDTRFWLSEPYEVTDLSIVATGLDELVRRLKADALEKLAAQGFEPTGDCDLVVEQLFDWRARLVRFRWPVRRVSLSQQLAQRESLERARLQTIMAAVSSGMIGAAEAARVLGEAMGSIGPSVRQAIDAFNAIAAEHVAWDGEEPQSAPLRPREEPLEDGARMIVLPNEDEDV